MATPGRKKKPHFFHGRGSCERCGGKMRVEEWSLPWDKATGYTCERCSDDIRREMEYEKAERRQKQEQQARRKEMELKLQQQQNQLEFQRQQITMTLRNSAGDRMQIRGDMQYIMSMMSSPQFAQGAAQLVTPPSGPALTYCDDSGKSRYYN